MIIIWVIGRGIYALNLIRTINSAYTINLITTDKNDFAGWSKKVNKVIYIKKNSPTFSNKKYVRNCLFPRDAEKINMMSVNYFFNCALPLRRTYFALLFVCLF